ncbi:MULTISPECIES: glycosyltransferase [Mycobacteriaceae]|uniref:Glycosyltransferase n=1 Tax=Mycolicibacterium parafortuitum TaxID=39692 RepID=A0ACC6MRK6_MYCPF|nr:MULTISPECIES: glycosyltransferase [Mycobacteriaceae]MDZ5089106.1 glycosyltransferase [Mycolicibacterium parafortuitum]GFM20835.1 glycosyltransferase [Mycobacterium sp. PO1]GFM25091.1 glycosyltransferase [Mycobacterium sp. PO2]
MPSVAIIGTRGYPSYYGGFETAVRRLAPSLINSGWDVTVYGRQGSTRLDDIDRDSRVHSRLTRGLETKSLSTLSYGLTSTIDAALRRPDAAIIMNVANGYFLSVLKARKIPTLLNVDGIEWERAKWNPLAKRVFRTGAFLSARWATELVFDARAIESYWQETFQVGGTFIPYGGDIPEALPVPNGLSHRSYVLVVARFVPENSVTQFFDAVPVIAKSFPVVIVGSSGYGGEFDDTARNLHNVHENVTWLGHISDDALLLSLWQHAGVYFHGHTVGGTNPALVQAMAAGAPILARDTVYNREVLDEGGEFVGGESAQIAQKVTEMMQDPVLLEDMASRNQGRAAEHYSWSKVCRDYETALSRIVYECRGH